MFALTSLPPNPREAGRLRTCVASWQRAGLGVVAFNRASEIPAIERLGLDGVELVSVPDAPAASTSDGGVVADEADRYVTINAMLDWAAARDAPVLIVNADIELRMEPWEMKRVRWVADGGLCYFIRHNYDGDPARCEREPYGIDGFLLHGRDASLFPRSKLSMGLPFWDYWLPHTFAQHGRPLWSVEFPAALHLNHARRWSSESWHRCALEFDRLTGVLGDGDRSLHACTAMAAAVRRAFDARRARIPQRPLPISGWVRERFGRRGPKTFIELGAHQGTDTAWMSALPDVTIHAFEPDPRNGQPSRPNVIQRRAAVAATDGRAPFILSREGWGQEWTHSSSLRRPKNHLARYPVTFGDTIEVETVALDTYARERQLATVDFLWADIQGAEGDMIEGGRNTLSRTRYLYTEYSDDELYEGQVPLSRILEMLPGFRVLELWSDDVLLENRALGA